MGDDELTQAIALSLVAAEPPKLSEEDQAKNKLRVRVKELFMQYTQAGMPANQAAIEAMQSARAELGLGPSTPQQKQDQLRQRVKELFTKLTAQGMPPNQAAVEAMKL